MAADKIAKLVAVGKSSSESTSFRTHMLSMIVRQAAGTAAAIAVKDNVTPGKIAIKKLQAQLEKAGIVLPQVLLPSRGAAAQAFKK